jgi:hypothetical protein
MGPMPEQLVLLDDRDADWRLDERTRQLGREGVADARRVLAEALRRAASRAAA